MKAPVGLLVCANALSLFFLLTNFHSSSASLPARSSCAPVHISPENAKTRTRPIAPHVYGDYAELHNLLRAFLDSWWSVWPHSPTPLPLLLPSFRPAGNRQRATSVLRQRWHWAASSTGRQQHLAAARAQQVCMLLCFLLLLVREASVKCASRFLTPTLLSRRVSPQTSALYSSLVMVKQLQLCRLFIRLRDLVTLSFCFFLLFWHIPDHRFSEIK